MNIGGVEWNGGWKVEHQTLESGNIGPLWNYSI